MSPLRATATVLNIDKRGDDYVVTVQLKGEKSLRKFDKFLFDHRPSTGWVHHGWFDLVYNRDPKLKAGEVFELHDLQPALI